MNIRVALRTVLVLLPAVLACSLFSQAIQPAQAPSSVAPQSFPTTAAGETRKPVRQWASAAQASSEYGTSDWAASQATGAPNTLECGDIETAWAAANRDTSEWINLYFTTPVYPTEIRIMQTYNPDQVVQVDLIDMQGQFVTIYTGQPRLVESPCPYGLSIPVSRSDILAQGVRITINQSVLELGWNEIDAVEIAGMPGEGVPVRPPLPTP
jgi:hypothetical protein